MALNQDVPLVEVSWECSMDMELHPAPANFTAPVHFVDKQPVMCILFATYDEGEGEGRRQFGAFQQAGFALASPAAIKAVLDNPRELRAVGDSFKAWTKFFVAGIILDSKDDEGSAEETLMSPNEGPAARIVDNQDTTVEAPADSPRPGFFVRTFGRRLSDAFGSLRQAPAISETGQGLQVPSMTTLKRPSEESPTARAPIAKKQKTRTRRSKPIARSQRVANSVKNRDSYKCIFTFNRGGIEAAHILPHAVNSTAEGVDFFTRLLPHLSTMFGERFTSRLKGLLGSTVSSDESWNMLTLNVYVHRLYDAGLIGFRPIKITEGKDDLGISFFQVHLAIHWLGKSKLRMQYGNEVESIRLVHMAALREDFKANRGDYDVLNTVTRKHVSDGQEAVVRHYYLENATKMYDCLAFSWAMRMMLFLAGGAGTPDGDPKSDEFYDEERDITAQQIENEERLFKELMQLEERRGVTGSSSSPSTRAASLPRRFRRQESSEDSAANRSISSSLRHFSPVPSLEGSFPFNSSIFRRRRSGQDTSDDSQHSTVSSTIQTASSRSRSEVASSRTTVTSFASDKAAAGGRQLDLQVASQKLQFARNPKNSILEIGESRPDPKNIGELANHIDSTMQQQMTSTATAGDGGDDE